MAIFTIYSTKKNVHQDSQNNPPHNIPGRTRTPSNHAPRSPEDVVMQFDDDMAHFVTHLDADPLAESHLKTHLVEYNIQPEETVVKDIVEEEDGYTFLSFKKLSYAAVTALLPPSRTPTPPVTTPVFPIERPASAQSNRKCTRQRDFTASVIRDNEFEGEFDWNAHKASRGKTRAKGLAKKRGVKP